VSAAVLVVTAISGTSPAGGFLAATPGGSPFAGSSNLNTNGSGDIRPNLVVVPLGADGSVDMHLLQVEHVVVDVVGWFTDSTKPAATAGRFVSNPPTREVDTRIGQGFSRLPGLVTRTFDPVTAPANAAAFAQNITIVGNAAPLFVTPYPGGELPLVSAGNTTAADQIHAVLAFTKFSSPPATMSYYTNAATDLVVDSAGYFQG
jgi:hypothetical protein